VLRTLACAHPPTESEGRSSVAAVDVALVGFYSPLPGVWTLPYALRLAAARDILERVRAERALTFADLWLVCRDYQISVRQLNGIEPLPLLGFDDFDDDEFVI
jgi:hypothetical protein